MTPQYLEDELRKAIDTLQVAYVQAKALCHLSPDGLKEMRRSTPHLPGMIAGGLWAIGAALTNLGDKIDIEPFQHESEVRE